jgi:hypothetical protein
MFLGETVAFTYLILRQIVFEYSANRRCKCDFKAHCVYSILSDRLIVELELTVSE